MDTKLLVEKIDFLISKLNELRDIAIDAVPELPEWAKERHELGKCLFCNEIYGDSVIVRMDHERCYRKVERSIKKGDITEKQAIESGLVGPPSPVGRKKDTEVLSRILRMEKAKQDALGLSKIRKKPPKT
jgi:hypothetical protein